MLARMLRSGGRSRLDGPAVLARLLLLGAALLFSTGGAVIKSCALSGLEVACLRSGVAALALLLLLPSARRSLACPGTCLRAALVGVAYAATMLLFVLANKSTTAAHTIFLQSTAPLYVLVLGPVFLGERSRRVDLLWIGLVAFGLLFLVLGEQEGQVTAPHPARGNLLATIAGLSWGLTILGLRWLGRDADRPGAGMAGVILGNALACVLVLPFVLPLPELWNADGLRIAFLGLFQIGLAYLCLTAALGRVPAFEAAFLLLLEPVLSPIWSYLVHAEVPGAWAVLGGVLILAATLGRSFYESWLSRRRAA